MVDLGIFNYLSASLIDTLGLLTNSVLILLMSFALVDRCPDRGQSAIVLRSLNDCSQDLREFAFGTGILCFSIYHLLIEVTERSSMSFFTHYTFLAIE